MLANLVPGFREHYKVKERGAILDFGMGDDGKTASGAYRLARSVQDGGRIQRPQKKKPPFLARRPHVQQLYNVQVIHPLMHFGGGVSSWISIATSTPFREH